MTQNINDIIGEREAMGQSRLVLPVSIYPCELFVAEISTTDVKPVTTMVDGKPVVEEKGGTPFLDLTASVIEGPFVDESVQNPYYLSTWHNGGGLQLLAGACRQIVGQPADSDLFNKFGIVFAPKADGQDDRSYNEGVRQAIADAVKLLAPADKLKFLGGYARVDKWNGKKVGVSIDIEYRYFAKVPGGQEQEIKGKNATESRHLAEKAQAEGKEVRVQSRNKWNGFYAFDHPNYGFNNPAFKAKTFRKQAEMKAAMAAGE